MAEWIRVKDRLPKSCTSVLVYFRNGNIGLLFYEEGTYMPWLENVSHWMPLPEPPKDGET